MTRFGLDSTSQVPTVAHRAVGSTVALRYLSRFSWKVLKSTEAATYRSASIDLVTVFEDMAGNALKGHGQGMADAHFAAWQAQSLGMPKGRPVYFAVDFDATPSQQAAINDYLRGAAEIIGIGRVGVYGSYYVCKRCFDAGVVRYGWQTYAWSGGNFDRRCHLYQYSNGHTVGGVGVDFNHVYASDFGQWHGAPTPTPKPKPARQASGKWKAEITFDPQGNHGEGHYQIHGIKGVNVQRAEKPTTYKFTGTVDAHKGPWTIHRNGRTN